MVVGPEGLGRLQLKHWLGGRAGGVGKGAGGGEAHGPGHPWAEPDSPSLRRKCGRAWGHEVTWGG